MSSDPLVRFPRLRAAEAERLATDLLISPASVGWRDRHPEQVYAAIGGPKVDEAHLLGVREAVLTAISDARRSYDSDRPGTSGISWETRFDVHVGAALHEALGMSRSEAAVPGVWSWITLVLLPDQVAHRYPRTENRNRVLGGLRNMFSVTWWPIEVLGRDLVDPGLTGNLQVDEIVGLFERPALSRYNGLARQYARTVQSLPPSGRMLTTREFAKVVRRVAAHTSWTTADHGRLAELLVEAAGRAAETGTTHDPDDSPASINAEVRLADLALPFTLVREDAALQPRGSVDWTAIPCPSTTAPPTAIVVEGGTPVPLTEAGESRRGVRYKANGRLSNGVRVTATVIRRPDDVYLECRIR